MEGALRKAGPHSWRSRPEGHEAWLLAYDLSETGLFVSDAFARRASAGVLSVVNATATKLHGIALVRGGGRVLIVPAPDSAVRRDRRAPQTT